MSLDNCKSRSRLSDPSEMPSWQSLLGYKLYKGACKSFKRLCHRSMEMTWRANTRSLLKNPDPPTMGRTGTHKTGEEDYEETMRLTSELCRLFWQEEYQTICSFCMRQPYFNADCVIYNTNEHEIIRNKLMKASYPNLFQLIMLISWHSASILTHIRLAL